VTQTQARRGDETGDPLWGLETERTSDVDVNQPIQDFQQWLESLDEGEVRGQVEAVERDLESLHRRRELLEQAIALKHEWLALSPSDASGGSAPAEEPTPYPSVPAWGERSSESEPSASDDVPVMGADGVEYAPNSLAARLAR
jgi:hypothetical protein